MVSQNLYPGLLFNTVFFSDVCLADQRNGLAAALNSLTVTQRTKRANTNSRKKRFKHLIRLSINDI